MFVTIRQFNKNESQTNIHKLSASTCTFLLTDVAQNHTGTKLQMCTCLHWLVKAYFKHSFLPGTLYFPAEHKEQTVAPSGMRDRRLRLQERTLDHTYKHAHSCLARWYGSLKSYCQLSFWIVKTLLNRTSTAEGGCTEKHVIKNAAERNKSYRHYSPIRAKHAKNYSRLSILPYYALFPY